MKSIWNSGIRDSFEIAQLSGKPEQKMEEKWKLCKASVRELEARWRCEGLFYFN